MSGWTSFPYIPRSRRTFADTLVFNDRMEWANVPQRDGDGLGWHDQKIPFLRLNVPLVAVKRS